MSCVPRLRNRKHTTRTLDKNHDYESQNMGDSGIYTRSKIFTVIQDFLFTVTTTNQKISLRKEERKICGWIGNQTRDPCITRTGALLTELSRPISSIHNTSLLRNPGQALTFCYSQTTNLKARNSLRNICFYL